jgi:hypothetical protein
MRALYTYFFTQEASDDYLRMLVVVRQYILFYTVQRGSEIFWRFVIPGRITQDFLENTFAEIKLRVGHNGLTAINVVRAVHVIETSRVHQTSSRAVKRKRNTGVNGADEGEGEGDEPVCSIESRFVPFEVLELFIRSRKVDRLAALEASGYLAAFEKIKSFDFA